MSAEAKILLVEDDQNLGFVIKDNLEIAGFSVRLSSDGENAWQTFQRGNFEICILDIMLPHLDGFSLAEKIRGINREIPIIFLTAKSMKEDKIAGFKVGADDYVTKPFSIEELILRIKVFLKRSNFSYSSSTPTFQINNFLFDYNNLSLTSPNKSTILTQKEADLLKLFCTRKSEVLKREEILKSIWGDDDYFMGRSLDVFISRLRSYLKEDPTIEIVNIHGIGFKITY